MGQEGGPWLQLIHVTDDQIQQQRHKRAAVVAEFRNVTGGDVADVEQTLWDLQRPVDHFQVVDDVFSETPAVA